PTRRPARRELQDGLWGLRSHLYEHDERTGADNRRGAGREPQPGATCALALAVIRADHGSRRAGCRLGTLAAGVDRRLLRLTGPTGPAAPGRYCAAADSRRGDAGAAWRRDSSEGCRTTVLPSGVEHPGCDHDWTGNCKHDQAWPSRRPASG